MKQIVQNMRNGKMSVLDVPAPQVGTGEVLVATRASLISAGTERMLIDFANKSLLSKAQERPDLVKKVMGKLQRDGVMATASAVFSRLEEPLPLGYSAAGEVIAVGAGMESTYRVGDRVAMAGAGIANHAEVNAVPRNLVVPVPDNVPYEHASFATLVSIAMHGFRNAKVGLGDRVLIMGLGLVGQLTVQLAKRAGCRVFAVDYDADRVNLAEETGADKVHLLSAGGAHGLVEDFTQGKGFDSVIICAATDSNAPIEQAAHWARDRATIVMTGKVGCEIPYADYMKKELQFVISRSYGPGRYDKNYEAKGQSYPIGYVRWSEHDNIQEAINLMADGSLKIDRLISHSFPIEESSDAYALVMGKEIPSMGVVLTYGASTQSRLKPRIDMRPHEIVPGNVGLGFLGAGAFARGVLLPALKDVEEVSFTGILSKGGTTAATVGEKFEFSFAAANEQEILDDKNTHAVAIVTRHNTHARLVCDALQRNKHVFVEKPLAMTHNELAEVEKTYHGSGRVLMVGFNRRFAPFVQALQDNFEHVAGPRQVMIRVNAGKLEGDNWQNDVAVGGGRLLGEACHFIDLALYLTGSRPHEIYAVKGTGQDVYHITIRMENGSVATVIYTSEGDSAFSKEYIEMYAGGQVGVIDNFRQAYVMKNGKKVKFKTGNALLGGGQDKGHFNELAAFVSAVKGEKDCPMSAQDIFTTTRATLLAHDAIMTGRVQPFDDHETSDMPDETALQPEEDVSAAPMKIVLPERPTQDPDEADAPLMEETTPVEDENIDVVDDTYVQESVQRIDIEITDEDDNPFDDEEADMDDTSDPTRDRS